MDYNIQKHDVFQAIGIDQSFEILEIDTYSYKKVMIVDIWRNGFLTNGEVDYKKYAPLLLNTECYKQIRLPERFNID